MKKTKIKHYIKCPVCGKQAAVILIIKLHKERHVYKAPYHCTVCDCKGVVDVEVKDNNIRIIFIEDNDDKNYRRN